MKMQSYPFMKTAAGAARRLARISLAIILMLSALPTFLYSAPATPEQTCYSYVMPMIYDDIRLADKYIYFSKNGRWGRASLDGKILAEANFSSLDEAQAAEKQGKQPPLIPFKAENGLYGYKNAAGEIVIEAKYDAVSNYFDGGAAIVQYKGKYGVIDSVGNTLFDFICDTLYKSDVNGCYAYSQNGKTGFLDSKLNILSQPFLKATYAYMYDGYVVYQATGGKYGLADYGGKVLCGAVWDYIRSFCEGLAAVGVNEDIYGINVRWGYIDKKGNTALPAVYDCYNPESLDFSEGLAGVCDGQDGYYIDKTGKIVLTLPKGTFPYTKFSNGLAAVSFDLIKKYINKSGETVVAAGSGVKWYRAGAFSGGLAVVSSSFDAFTQGYAGVIKYNGNTPSLWAQAEVTDAINHGLVPDGLKGQYTAAISRAEYCRLAVALIESFTGKNIAQLTGEVKAGAFTDTDDENVLYARELGIVEGRGGGIFDPSGRIKRQEAAKILVNTFKSCAFLPSHTSEKPRYADRASIEQWAEEGIWYTGEWGVMIGVGGNLFDPTGSYTREQAILTMVRLYNVMAANRPKTYYISPEVTVTDGRNEARYAADPDFFIKISVPAGWDYDGVTGIFSSAADKSIKKASLSDVLIYISGKPGSADYRLYEKDNIYLSINFFNVSKEDIYRITKSARVYDRAVPSMNDDIDSYMYYMNSRAFEAIGWFEMSAFTGRAGGIDYYIKKYGEGPDRPAAVQTPGVDGFIAVNDYKIKTYSDLEAYLKTLFSDNIVQNLLGTGLYTDIGGKLYASAGDRGSDITKGAITERTVKRESDKKITYTIRVELRGGDDPTRVTGYETHTYTMEQIGSKWVWTDISLYN